jgi:hypothetical protein
MRSRTALVVAIAAMLAGSVTVAQSPGGVPPYHPAAQAIQLDLTKPFHTHSPWRLVVTEGPQVKDYGDNDAPGALTLCLDKGSTGPCLSDPVTLPLRAPTPDFAIAWEPHYLLTAKVVYPHGPAAAPLLLIVTGSLNSGDGDQIVATQLVSYDVVHDEFLRVPEEHLPYGFWIVVYKPSPTGTYRETLRYRSATRYNDGNPLAVIDSEMPNIERRLGFWKPGDPLPAPRLAGNGKPCTRPMLKHAELWCE